MRRPDTIALELKREELLEKLQQMLDDGKLLAEIRTLIGIDFSARSILKMIAPVSIDPHKLQIVRDKVSRNGTDPLEAFDELIDVSKEIDRIHNPLIKY